MGWHSERLSWPILGICTFLPSSVISEDPIQLSSWFRWFTNLHLSLLFFKKKILIDLRETSICCPTYWCIHWLILVCALTENWTHNLGGSRQHSDQLCHLYSWAPFENAELHIISYLNASCTLPCQHSPGFPSSLMSSGPPDSLLEFTFISSTFLPHHHLEIDQVV